MKNIFLHLYKILLPFIFLTTLLLPIKTTGKDFYIGSGFQMLYRDKLLNMASPFNPSISFQYCFNSLDVEASINSSFSSYHHWNINDWSYNIPVKLDYRIIYEERIYAFLGFSTNFYAEYFNHHDIVIGPRAGITIVINDNTKFKLSGNYLFGLQNLTVSQTFPGGTAYITDKNRIGYLEAYIFIKI